MSGIAIYQHQAGSIDVRLEQETVWLNQQQLAILFGRDSTVIGRHIKAVFTEGELEEQSNVQKMHIATSDKPIALYSLDVIISVGYRVKSPEGVRFRQPVVNDVGLAALSHQVAESKPADKDILIRLIKNMLAGEDV